MTWHDAASVRIMLRVLTTQRHNCERAARACWLAISQVRFLYGLPTYIGVYTFKDDREVKEFVVRRLVTQDINNAVVVAVTVDK
jgi:hypothetical protein